MKTRITLWMACIVLVCTSAALGQLPAEPTSQYANSQYGPSPSAQQWTISSFGTDGPQATSPNDSATNPTTMSVSPQPANGAVSGAVGGNSANCGLGNQYFGYDPNCPTRYVSLFGGVAAFPDIDYAIDLSLGNLGTQSADLLLDTDTGWAIGGAIGRSLGRKLRTEFEVTYRSASVAGGSAESNGQLLGTIPLDGSLNMYSFMPNLLFDFRPNSRFNPYVGVGTGVVFQDLEVVEPTTQLNLNIKDSAFAYQAILGFSTCLSARTDLFVEYRFFGTDQFSVDVGTPIGSVNFDTDTTSNNVLFGLRIKRW